MTIHHQLPPTNGSAPPDEFVPNWTEEWLLAPLTPTQRDVVTQHLVHAEKFADIGAGYGHTDEWARRCFKKAIAVLKHVAAQAPYFRFKKNPRPDLHRLAQILNDGFWVLVRSNLSYAASLRYERSLYCIRPRSEPIPLAHFLSGAPRAKGRSLSPEEVAVEIALHPEWHVAPIDQQAHFTELPLAA